MRQGTDFELSFDTDTGRVQVIHIHDEDDDIVRILKCGDTFESSTYLGERYCEPFFPYIREFDLIFRANIPITRTLMLGGGAFSYPKFALSRHPEISMDVVEIDEGIVDIARDLFGLDDCIEEYDLEESGRLKIHITDALSFLKETDETYDAIINDAFVKSMPVPELADEHAAFEFARHLVPGGIFAVNVVAALEGRKSQHLRRQVEALRAAFAHVWVVPMGADEPKIPDNNIVLACNERLDVPENYRL